MLNFSKSSLILNGQLKRLLKPVTIYRWSGAQGTPTGNFLGVPPTGKKLRIMAIDIHTIVNSYIIKSYHLEDWSSAIPQLSGR